MGTVIDQVAVTRAGWRKRHSALYLAVTSASDCLRRAGRTAQDVDLLVNAGVYRDRNLGEPALAAMIQQDIGANPEDPHTDAHGTFSFDVVNGTCGILSALQVIDGFLKSRAIDCALVVASDADPGRGMSEHFPFAPVGAALMCHWNDDDYGLQPISWVHHPEGAESFTATVGLIDRRNVLRFDQSADVDDRFAQAAAEAADKCLAESGLTLREIDVVVAAPARDGYRAALADRLGVPPAGIIVADDERMHTAALAGALQEAADRIPEEGRLLLVAAGAGITAGAAVYRTRRAR